VSSNHISTRHIEGSH